MEVLDIYKLFRQIVIDSPYLSGGGQLNSFAVLDNLSQLNAANEEMSFADYRKGWFWSRATENKGGQPKNIKLEYDMLMVETVKSSIMTSPFSNEICHPMFISVASPVECEGCKHRTIPEIDQRNLFNLQVALREFFTYGLYDVVMEGLGSLGGAPIVSLNDDGDDDLLGLEGADQGKLWLSEARAAWINAQEGTSAHGPRKVITSYVNPTPLDIFQGGKYIDNLRMKTVQIEICNCAPDLTQNFNYQPMSTNELLMLKCDSC